MALVFRLLRVRIKVCSGVGPSQAHRSIAAAPELGNERRFTKRAGRTLGRKAVEVDIAKVHRLRAEGLGLRVIAVRLGVSVNTLQKARRKGLS
jgi:hypothetical protein